MVSNWLFAEEVAECLICATLRQVDFQEIGFEPKVISSRGIVAFVLRDQRRLIVDIVLRRIEYGTKAIPDVTGIGVLSFDQVILRRHPAIGKTVAMESDN